MAGHNNCPLTIIASHYILLYIDNDGNEVRVSTMRELINQAEKVTREELSFMAFRLAAHYCELKFKALDDVLIIIEMVEAYEAR